MGKYAIGVDFGTNSVRTLIADVADGTEVGTYVFPYPSGEDGILLDPADDNLARQNPADYLVGLEESVRGAIRDAGSGFKAEEVVGVGVDTTGSTPLPVDEKGQPLAFRDEFKDNLSAQAWLWKDHTGHEEAARITEAASRMRPHYLAKCGGTYSSEWFFSKIWHCLNVDTEVFNAACSWVECADYIPGELTGNLDPKTIKRGVCPAGHKAMYAEDWGGLPDADFLGALAPGLHELRSRLYEKAVTADNEAGKLTESWAKKLGLPAGIPVAAGAFDAHVGAVAAGVRPGVLVKVMGTSSCDMAVVPNSQEIADIPGMCGIVDGSIVPGHFGIEAGQSAVGDIFNWFVHHLAPATERDAHEALTKKAQQLRPGESGLLVLDWNNGNRTILVDPRLSGLILGLSLHSTAEEIYRALIEGTAFGAREIVERMVEYGVRIDEVVCCGGIAEKNRMLMQIYADVLKRPMKISRSAQTCALGAAIFGAVVGGAYRKAEDAQEHMTGLKETVYEPDPEAAAVYDKLYTLYQTLHDGFGIPGTKQDISHVMKELLEIKAQAS